MLVCFSSFALCLFDDHLRPAADPTLLACASAIGAGSGVPVALAVPHAFGHPLDS